MDCARDKKGISRRFLTYQPMGSKKSRAVLVFGSPFPGNGNTQNAEKLNTSWVESVVQIESTHVHHNGVRPLRRTIRVFPVLDRIQCLLKIVYDILRLFEADGEPYPSRVDSTFQLFFWWNGGMCH